ncbi:hypothetical protein ACFY7C_19760 [Streptomyces sp. NPDC012769]|uniref:hypothetical protein n=1 Tax=Streptomyces sp. NPDC012769 TaxID=3364848 RepID=UPI0036A53BC0
MDKRETVRLEWRIKQYERAVERLAEAAPPDAANLILADLQKDLDQVEEDWDKVSRQ